MSVKSLPLDDAFRAFDAATSSIIAAAPEIEFKDTEITSYSQKVSIERRERCTSRELESRLEARVG